MGNERTLVIAKRVDTRGQGFTSSSEDTGHGLSAQNGLHPQHDAPLLVRNEPVIVPPKGQPTHGRVRGLGNESRHRRWIDYEVLPRVAGRNDPAVTQRETGARSTRATGRKLAKGRLIVFK